MSSRFSEPMKMNWKRPEYAEEEEEPSRKANGVKDSPPTRKSHVYVMHLKCFVGLHLIMNGLVLLLFVADELLHYTRKQRCYNECN